MGLRSLVKLYVRAPLGPADPCEKPTVSTLARLRHLIKPDVLDVPTEVRVAVTEAGRSWLGSPRHT